MSYAIYKTEAIVLRLIPSGEANVDAVLFTREFGKITVRAQSARKQESKMRMFLTRFRIVTVDLVRGKSVWRLTGITGSDSGTLFTNESVLQPAYRMFRLAEFLVQGEAPHIELFDFFKSVLGFAGAAPLHASGEGGSRSETGEDSGDRVRMPGKVGLEIFLVIKLLDHLGYWNGTVFPKVPTTAILTECVLHKKELVKKINESISATQIMIY